MPTYEYKCSNCGNEFEIIQSMKDEPLKKCPKCGKNKLRKIISGGVGVIFKGSGFYQTDYVNKKSKLAAKKSETPAVSDAGSKADTSGVSEAVTKTDSKSKEKKSTNKKDS